MVWRVEQINFFLSVRETLKLTILMVQRIRDDCSRSRNNLGSVLLERCFLAQEHSGYIGFSCCFASDSRNAVLAHGPSARNGDLRDLRGSLELPFWQWILESMDRSPPARCPLYLLRVKARLQTVHP